MEPVKESFARVALLDFWEFGPTPLKVVPVFVPEAVPTHSVIGEQLAQQMPCLQNPEMGEKRKNCQKRKWQRHAGTGRLSAGKEMGGRYGFLTSNLLGFLKLYELGKY